MFYLSQWKVLDIPTKIIHMSISFIICCNKHLYIQFSVYIHNGIISVKFLMLDFFSILSCFITKFMNCNNCHSYNKRKCVWNCLPPFILLHLFSLFIFNTIYFPPVLNCMRQLYSYYSTFKKEEPFFLANALIYPK